MHVDTWRTTYSGLLPDDLLDNLSYQTRAEGWRRMLTRNDPGEFMLVAEQDGEVVGFVTGGAARENLGDYAGEIYAIYLLAAYQKQGIGRALFEQARAALAERGYDGLMLWVLDGNPTEAFYQHMGGKFIGSKQEEVGGQEVPHRAYGWLKA